MIEIKIKILKSVKNGLKMTRRDLTYCNNKKAKIIMTIFTIYLQNIYSWKIACFSYHREISTYFITCCYNVLQR